MFFSYLFMCSVFVTIAICVHHLVEHWRTVLLWGSKVFLTAYACFLFWVYMNLHRIPEFTKQLFRHVDDAAKVVLKNNGYEL